jgi:hypothetical protein
MKSYHNEQQNFTLFTNKAENIRNNKFDEHIELIEEFDSFQKVISKNMTRKLYDLQLLSAFHMAFSQNSCNFAVP